jgi:hypothetical protein
LNQPWKPALFALLVGFSTTLLVAIPLRNARGKVRSDLTDVDVAQMRSESDAATTAAELEAEPARPSPPPKVAKPARPSTPSRSKERPAKDARSTLAAPRETRPLSPLALEAKYAGYSTVELRRSLDDAQRKVREISGALLDARAAQATRSPAGSLALSSSSGSADVAPELGPDVSPEVRDLYRELQWLAERLAREGG